MSFALLLTSVWTSYRTCYLLFYFTLWLCVLFFRFLQPSCAYERVQILDNTLYDDDDCNDDYDNVDYAINDEDNGDDDETHDD